MMLANRSNRTLRIAYLMSRFPTLTETFILYEILELERQGIIVEIFPLLRQREPVQHPEVERVLPRVRFLPFLSGPILAANARVLWRAPCCYLRTLAEVLWGARRSLNFFIGALGIFPKTVRMAEDMAKLGVNHLHAHFANHPALAALIIHRLTGLSYSFTAHGSDIHIDQTLFGLKLRSARFAVTVCRYNVEFLAERVGPWVRDHLRVLHCGINPDRFNPALEEPPQPRPFTILCVGTLREVKGHRVLIEACQRLSNRGMDFVCQIVGHGPLHAELKQRIRAAGLEDRVWLLGSKPQPEVVALMQAADVVTLPSILGSRGDREGIPVVLMEAMACEKPVVSSRQSGIPELVDEGINGLLCPAGDSECLAQAFLGLAADPAWRRRLGQAGRLKILQDFDQRRNAATLAEWLTEATWKAGDE